QGRRSREREEHLAARPQRTHRQLELLPDMPPQQTTHDGNVRRQRCVCIAWQEYSQIGVVAELCDDLAREALHAGHARTIEAAVNSELHVVFPAADADDPGASAKPAAATSITSCPVPCA